MPQISSISLSDTATPPIVHTLEPVLKDGPNIAYVSNIGDSVADRTRVNLNLRQGKLASGNTPRTKRKTTVKVQIPITSDGDASTGIPHDTVEVIVTCNVPLTAPGKTSKDALAFVKTLLADSQITSVIEDGQFPY